MRQCDVVVYNISESLTKNQVEEATWAITGMKWDYHQYVQRKSVLISVFPSPFSPWGRNGQLQISKNVNFSLNSDDLGRDQAAGSGASAGKLVTVDLNKDGLA